MTRKPYSTDLTDDQWAIVAPLLPPPRPRGRRPTVDRRCVLDAIFYQAKNGCVWQDLPRDLPHDSTVDAARTDVRAFSWRGRLSRSSTWR